MTEKQKELVYNLRLTLLRNHYPPIVAVDRETLEAAELAIFEWLEEMDRKYPFETHLMKCGKNGLLFKGC